VHFETVQANHDHLVVSWKPITSSNAVWGADL